MNTKLRRTLAILLLALSPVTLVGVWLLLRADVPSTIATHWDLSGRADGFTRSVVFVVVCALTALVASALGVLALRGGQPAAGHRPIIGLLGFASWLITCAVGSALLLAAGEAGPVVGIWVFVVTVAVAVLLGALIWWVVPLGDTSTPASPRADATYTLRPGERATWVGTASSRALLAVSLVTVAAGAVAVGFHLLVGALLLLSGLLIAWTHTLTVRVDNDAVTAHFGPVAWPCFRTPIDQIEGAEVAHIDPLTWGGWGYRRSTRGSAFVVRAGTGMVLSRPGRPDLALTLDRPDAGVGLVNALVATREKRSV